MDIQEQANKLLQVIQIYDYCIARRNQTKIDMSERYWMPKRKARSQPAENRWEFFESNKSKIEESKGVKKLSIDPKVREVLYDKVKKQIREKLSGENKCLEYVKSVKKVEKIIGRDTLMSSVFRPEELKELKKMIYHLYDEERQNEKVLLINDLCMQRI